MKATSLQFIVQIPKEVKGPVDRRDISERAHKIVFDMVVFVERFCLLYVKIICHQTKVNLSGCEVVLKRDQKEANYDAKRPISSSKRP